MSTTLQRPLPNIALTLGDPAGIGPELAVKVLAKPGNLDRARVFVLADRAEIESVCADIGVRIPLADTPTPGHATPLPGPTPLVPVERGKVSRQAGERALNDLRWALDLYRAGRVDGILYAPLNKSSLRQAGMETEDELRWFAEQLDFHGTTSELNNVDALWTGRVTSHIPLAEVALHITAPNVTGAIRLLHDALRGIGVGAPRLAVCALNPHAGENGHFGRQEIDDIAPGIEAARGEGIDATGPYPCDTLFIRARAGEFDGVVTMYHDQGQIALKTIGFDRGVTVQGGLPVPIATPASGTAFDIVGKGIANTGAVEHAFEVLYAMAASNAAARTR